MNNPASKDQNRPILRLHTAAILYFLSRSAVVAFVFVVPLIYFLHSRVEIPLVAGGAGGVTLLLIAYYLAAAGLRCNVCSSPVLMDNGSQKHSAARRLLGLSRRARVAWDILFRTEYQCMYCRAGCRCKKGSSAANPRLGEMLERNKPGKAEANDAFVVSPFSGVEGLEEEITSAGVSPDGDPDLLFGERPRAVPSPLPKPQESPSAEPPFKPFQPVAAKDEIEPIKIASLSPLDQILAAPASAFTEPSPLSPLPWTVPATAKTKDTETPMNRPFNESHPAPQEPNPFLAAAAAMGPPPGPILPKMPKAAPAPTESQPSEPPHFRQEFPFSGDESPQPANPTPWTLPSMPAPQFSKAMEATAVIPYAAPPSGLVKEVITALEAGQRALSNVFQSLIQKLEVTLGEAGQAPSVVPAAPMMPPRPRPEPVIPKAVDLPSFPPRPEPLMAPAAKTTPMPPPAPVLPVFEAPAPAAPRKKFARPSGLAAQQLTTALHEVFEPAPPAPANNGYVSNGHPPAPPLPPTMAPPRTQPPMPESVYSPFVVSSAPLSAPEGRPDEPVPFTFLTNSGGQFKPAPAPEPMGAYDPLDDTVLPWMQPLRGPAPRA